MELVIGWSWECYLLPVLLVVAWPLLWWRGSRRIRLWFAGLTPLGAFAGFFVGAVVALNNSSCVGAGCDSRGMQRAAGERAWFDLGVSIMSNAMLGFATAVALGLLTAVVELTLLGVRVRRRTALRRSAKPPPSTVSSR
jgi:hypothetical protein